MARPREFDVERVLAEAMEVFWLRGFEGASFAEIERRTGVKKASLFAAYGDKRSLFCKALAHYQEHGRKMCREKLHNGSPKQAVREWFLSAAALAKGKAASRGCLQVNSVVELAPHDPNVAALAREHTRLLVEIVADVVKQGQKRGEFRTDVRAAALAKYLVSSLSGLAVAGKAGMAARDIDAIANITLSTLDA
jgi:TetR/AcrR family transcriptional repressor of nem operon